MNFIKQHKSMFVFMIIGILISPLIYFGFLKTVKLTDFHITSFNQNISDIENYRKLSWTESKHASEYQVIILNDDLKILKIHDTTEPEIILDNIDTTYNKHILVNIKAIDENKNSKETTSKNYRIKWYSPTIDITNNSDILNNKDLEINILHNNSQTLDNYYFILSKNGNTIYKDQINNSMGIIPKEVMEMLIGNYELKLCTKINDTEYVINSKKINIQVPKITNIAMVYPTNNEVITWDDFTIKFDGGDNAAEYHINLIDKSKKYILKNIKIHNKSLDFIIAKLKENKEYAIEIIASNPLDNSVKKTKKIKFKTGKKQTTKVVESNTPNGNVTWNKKITLSSQTKDAKIFYTTDGTEPTTNSNLYTEPLKINSKTTIKAIAVRNNMYDSEISEFKYRPVSYGMGSSNTMAPIALYDEGYLPVRYYNQRTGGYASKTYGPENNDWDDGFTATIASHGCGPTALAIVVSTLTEKDINPAEITNYACNNGYCFENGTVNSFITHYPKKHGLSVTEANKSDKDKIINALKSKKSLVVALVGPGDFTTTSHFIVLRGASDDGKVLVADPNNLEKSKKFWDFDTILKQVKEPYFFIISK